MNRLHPKAALDELIGEIIQQFRMRRPHAHTAVIIRSADDTRPEVAKPYPINKHTRGEGIRRDL